MPATRHITIDGSSQLGTGQRLYVDWLSGQNSPRVGGRLRLVANPTSRTFGRVFGFSAPYYSVWGCQASAFDLSQTASEATRQMALCESSAYGRLRGRLYKGSASIGVTAASYKQSRTMIVARSQQIVQEADELIARSVTGRNKLKRLASTHLEVIFGWQPLLSDIHAAATSVIQLADARSFVKGSSQSRLERVDNGSFIRLNCSVELRCVMSACVTVTNPNRWLLERAGLLNPAAVAWDLVPWSFVINMFVNTGQLVNSITDFAGLTFSEASTTRAVRGTYRYDVEPGNPRYHSWSQWFNRHKTRSVGGNLPTPPVVFKLPDVSWETAAMAASLMVQKATTAINLVGRLLKR